MPVLFEPNEAVEIRLASDDAPIIVTGRVIAHSATGPGDDGRYWLYAVLLDQPVQNYPWPAIIMPGAAIRRLPPLKALAREGCEP